MAESNAGSIFVSDDDYSTALELEEHTISRHPFRRTEIEWFTNGEQLQKPPSGLGESVEAARDCLLNPWRGSHSTRPSPDAMDHAKFACFEKIGDQFASEEDVPLGRLPHSVRRDALDNPFQSPLEHLVELGSRQGLKFEPRKRAVSSESAQRIGDGRSTAQRQEHGRQTPDGDVVDKSRGGPVEQVHVVDGEDD